MIKKSTIQKEAMPTFNIGPIRLKFHAGDVNELICKLHVYEDQKLYGTIFLDEQGKRIIKYKLKHPDIKDILDYLKNKENRTTIENKFGQILYDAGYVKSFKLNNNFIQLILSSSKRKTPIFDIREAEDFLRFPEEAIQKLRITPWKFDRSDGLCFIFEKGYDEISWSNLLFYN